MQAKQKLRAAEVKPEPALARGDSVWLAGLNSGHAIARRRSTVISATHGVALAHPHVPRFRAVHEEVGSCCGAACMAKYFCLSQNEPRNPFLSALSTLLQ
jgi:hypothetical protein